MLAPHCGSHRVSDTGRTILGSQERNLSSRKEARAASRRRRGTLGKGERSERLLGAYQRALIFVHLYDLNSLGQRWWFFCVVVSPTEHCPLAEAPEGPATSCPYPGGGWEVEFAEEFAENLGCKHITREHHLLVPAHLLICTTMPSSRSLHTGASLLSAFALTVSSTWKVLLSPPAQ